MPLVPKLPPGNALPEAPASSNLREAGASHRGLPSGSLVTSPNRLLLVAFTGRFRNVRIISARLTTRQEREDYEQNAL
jgi:uncharacterized DUF497 family protein